MTDAAKFLIPSSLACRFFNKDGASAVRERLDEPAIVAWFSWFQSPHACNSGELLLRIAPLFDTSLERIALLGLPGSEGPDVRHGAYSLFGVGLAIGAWVLAASEQGSPFLASVDVNEVLGLLAARGLDRGEESGGDTLKESPPPALVTSHLVLIDPELDLCIQAGVRLAKSLGRKSLRVDHDTQPLRFLFFLGLLGAGIQLPVKAAAPKRATVRRRNKADNSKLDHTEGS